MFHGQNENSVTGTPRDAEVLDNVERPHWLCAFRQARLRVVGTAALQVTYAQRYRLFSSRGYLI